MEDTLHITGLEPIIAPGRVPFWPPAPGWYVVAGVVLLLLFYAIYLTIKKRKKNRYRTQALNILKGIREGERTETGPKEINELNQLLKITALAAFSRERVASLSGNEWLEFLEFTCPGTTFTAAPGNLLAQVGLMAPGSVEIPQEDWMELIRLSESWIAHHRRESDKNFVEC